MKKKYLILILILTLFAISVYYIITIYYTNRFAVDITDDSAFRIQKIKTWTVREQWEYKFKWDNNGYKNLKSDSEWDFK